MIFRDIHHDWLQMEIIDRLSSRRQRDQYLSALLNGSPDVDIQLTEAVKVVVMLAAINAHENFISGVETSSPVIVWQTFGRRSSLSAEMFFHEHVNCIGDGAILGDSKVRLLLSCNIIYVLFSCSIFYWSSVSQLMHCVKMAKMY